MKKIHLLLFILMTSFAFAQTKKGFVYPETKKGNQVDTYFEKKVSDPYRWLEDDRSAETGDWVKRQNELTFAYIKAIPYRDAIEKRITALINYTKISAPTKHGAYIYFYKNDGLQNQSVMYRKDAAGKEEVFLDPNKFSKDATTSLDQVSFTNDGLLVAYSISEAGSDWRKVIIMDASNKQILEDTLIDIKFSGMSWYKNEGIYYSSYEKPKGSELSEKTDQHRVYYHALGTSQATDKVIFGETQKRRYVGAGVTEDNRYLFISAANSTSGNELYLLDLTNPNAKIVTLVDNMEADYGLVDNEGSTILVETNAKAKNKKVMVFDAMNPEMKNWKDLIPETEQVLSTSTGGGYIFANYMKDAVSVVKQYDYSGKFIREIKLPGLGSASGFGSKKDENTVYFSFTNYVTPSTLYSLDSKKGEIQLYEQPKVNFNPSDYESKQVFYTSKDGTKVPMMITHKKGIVLNGKNPTNLYGYGGFNISLTPSFNVFDLVWMENGGVNAVANLRGGGEYGSKWHDEGTKMKKQNVFDDFIAAAEYLQKENYCTAKYLAIEGGSNGGLLVGAVLTQRPDLFQVALPAVGVLDMLRYNAFTIGAAWSYDYGTAQDSKEMFEYLLNYSPVHTVKSGTKYPATLVTTGDHDDRVVPAHSFKFAAELQAKQAGDSPVMIRIETNAGHGAGKPLSKRIAEAADVQAFSFYNMGIKKLNDGK